MVPKGQAMVHTLQPTQVASSTTFAPVRVHLDGVHRAGMHAPGFAHWVQV
jgi:hypothetical protein